jgi:hypothetical protein
LVLHYDNCFTIYVDLLLCICCMTVADEHASATGSHGSDDEAASLGDRVIGRAVTKALASPVPHITRTTARPPQAQINADNSKSLLAISAAMGGLVNHLVRPAVVHSPPSVSSVGASAGTRLVCRQVNDEAEYLLRIAGWVYSDVEAWALKLLGTPTADNRVQATLMAALLEDEHSLTLFINRVFNYVAANNTVDLGVVVADIFRSFGMEEPLPGSPPPGRGACLSRRTVTMLANGVLYKSIAHTFGVSASASDAMADY